MIRTIAPALATMLALMAILDHPTVAHAAR